MWAQASLVPGTEGLPRPLYVPDTPQSASLSTLLLQLGPEGPCPPERHPALYPCAAQAHSSAMPMRSGNWFLPVSMPGRRTGAPHTCACPSTKHGAPGFVPEPLRLSSSQEDSRLLGEARVLTSMSVFLIRLISETWAQKLLAGTAGGHTTVWALNTV